MLGLGANISGGSPVGASGVAAPPPPSDYIYESDFTTDSFLNTSVVASVVDHEGRSDVLKYYNNNLATFNSRNYSVNLSPGSYEIDFWYYVPSGSTFEGLRIYKRLGTTDIIEPDEIQYDQWVNLTHNFPIDRETYLLILFDTSSASSGDSIFISDIKISLNIATSPSPPPGGYYDGALDQSSVSYEGAAAAYSLRLVYSYYDGSAIRVRRASDNTEQDIGFSNGVLDTSTLSTFCSGTDGFVKVWYDQANGNDATQTTTANQPKIYDASAGVVLDNSKPAVEFDGTNDVVIKTSVSVTNEFVSVFGVQSPDVANVSQVAAALTNETTGTRRGIWFRQTGEAYASGFANNLKIGNYSGATRYLATGFFDNAANTISGSFNGTFTAAASYTLNDLSSPHIAIGEGNGGFSEFFNGKIQEVIIYPSDQSANRTGIETNINDHYNIY